MEQKIKDAKVFFHLNDDFNEDDLELQYNNAKKIVAIDFIEKKAKEENALTEEYYSLLKGYIYRKKTLCKINNTYLKDIDINSRKVMNIPQSCIDFYKNDVIHRCLKNLVFYFEINFKVLNDMVHDTTNKQKIDMEVEIFLHDMSEDYQLFLSNVLDEGSKEYGYKRNILTIPEYDIRVASIRDIMLFAYNVNQNYITKNRYMEGFKDAINQNFPINTEEYKKVFEYYVKMISEKNFEKFEKIYEEANNFISELITIAPVSPKK